MAGERSFTLGLIPPEAEYDMAGATPRWSDLAALAAMAEGVSFDSVGFVDQSEYVHSISPNPGD